MSPTTARASTTHGHYTLCVALHLLRGAAPLTWRCTCYVAVHPNRRGVMPTDRVHCPLEQVKVWSVCAGVTVSHSGEDCFVTVACGLVCRGQAAGAAPVTWRCTRYVALHLLRGGAPEQKGCNAYGSGAPPHQQAQPRICTPPHGQALHHWACAHVVEGLLMRLWSRPLIVAGIGVVSQGQEEDPAAVQVGGGRAWPGNK